MGQEWVFDLFRNSRDPTGREVLRLGTSLERIAKDSHRPMMELEIVFDDNQRLRRREPAIDVEAMVDSRKVRSMMAWYGTGSISYPSCMIWGGLEALHSRDLERVRISNRVFGFREVSQELRYLDLCIGNFVEAFNPTLFAFRIEEAYSPTPNELDLGYPTTSNPFIGYFPPNAIAKRPAEFWRALVEAILHPDPAIFDPETDRPWIRYFPNGGLMYRLVNRDAFNDLRLMRIFSSELQVAAEP